MAITLKHVASHAGVSIATVSLVLNGRGEALKISQPCIKRVTASAELLGYRSNYHARTLKSGVSRTLGMVKADDTGSFLTNRIWSVIAAGIDVEARAQGYHLLLLGAGDGKDPLANTKQAMDERRIDALIALDSPTPPSLALCRHQVPLVMIGGKPRPRVAQVAFDAEPGLRAAIAHLHELGHRTVLAFTGAWRGNESTPERSAAMTRAALELGLELRLQPVETEVHLPELERNIELHRQRLAPLLPLDPAVTAVMCWNDSMALALVSLLHERGVRVPEQLSVVGFDDLHAGHVVPPLTTVSHALIDQGRRAVQLAIERLDPEIAAGPARIAVVPSFLVVRRSTGPVRSLP